MQKKKLINRLVGVLLLVLLFVFMISTIIKPQPKGEKPQYLCEQKAEEYYLRNFSYEYIVITQKVSIDEKINEGTQEKFLITIRFTIGYDYRYEFLCTIIYKGHKRDYVLNKHVVEIDLVCIYFKY